MAHKSQAETEPTTAQNAARIAGNFITRNLIGTPPHGKNSFSSRGISYIACMDINVPKMQFTETTIPLIREHFRLAAEVRALKGWLREMWIQSPSCAKPETEARQQ